MMDPFAHMRAKAAAMAKLDPKEKARQQRRAQLVARLELMKKQVAAGGGDFSSERGIWETLMSGIKQREVYVGNLAVGQVLEHHLQQLFNQSLAQAFPETAQPGKEAVKSINMHTEGKYAFVEFRDANMATTALHLDGVELMGSPLAIGRPSGWVDPNKSMEELRRAEEDLRLFDQGVDIDEYRKQEEERNRVAALEKAADGESVGRPSKYICVENMVTRNDLADHDLVRAPATRPWSTAALLGGVVHDAGAGVPCAHLAPPPRPQYNDLKLDLKDECQALAEGVGTVNSVAVPRPQPSDLEEFFGKGHYSKAYVEFSNVEAAIKARKGVDGRMFDGRKLIAKFVDIVTYGEASIA